jgi:hypothetical protein
MAFLGCSGDGVRYIGGTEKEEEKKRQKDRGTDESRAKRCLASEPDDTRDKTDKLDKSAQGHKKRAGQAATGGTEDGNRKEQKEQKQNGGFPTTPAEEARHAE